MRIVRGGLAGICALGILALTGCQAVHPAVIRINFDGSIDYVTCIAEANDWTAYSMDETEELTDLPSGGDLGPTSAGSVVHFSRPEGEWARIYVGASSWSYVFAYSDDVSLGEWRWNTDGAWFTSDDRARCSIDE